MKDKAKGPALAGLAVVLAAMVSGCATVNYSSPGALNGVAVEGSENAASGQAVAITTSGYYMFWTIPLVSGDLRWDTGSGEIRGGTSFFQDQVGYQELQNALHKIAERSDCTYAGASYSGVIGALFGSSHMSVSAVLVPRKAKAK